MRKSLLCDGVSNGREGIGPVPPAADDVAKAHLVSAEASAYEEVALKGLAGPPHEGLAGLLLVLTRILPHDQYGGAWHDTIRDDAAPAVLPIGTPPALVTVLRFSFHTGSRSRASQTTPQGPT
jgi:hypothetical protein